MVMLMTMVNPAQYTKEEKRQIKEQFKNATMQAAKAAGNEKLPNGVKKLVDSLVNPQLTWRELLPQQIQSVTEVITLLTHPSVKVSNLRYLDAWFRQRTNN